jgi:hypothetical protein
MTGMSDGFSRLRLIAAVPAMVLSAGFAGTAASPEASRAGPGTIGLVITGWHHALHETSDPRNECSTGLTAGDYENVALQPNYAELRRKFGHPFSRGPNGERSAPLLRSGPAAMRRPDRGTARPVLPRR